MEEIWAALAATSNDNKSPYLCITTVDGRAFDACLEDYRPGWLKLSLMDARLPIWLNTNAIVTWKHEEPNWADHIPSVS